MHLKPGMKIKLKDKFLDSFLPSKNAAGEMDYLQGRIVTIHCLENNNIEFHINESPRWYFGPDYIDYIVNDNQMEIE